MGAAEKSAPTFINSSYTNFPTDTSTYTCNVPTNTQNGDLMVAFMCGDGGAFGSVLSWSSNPTFTFGIQRVTSASRAIAVAFRVASNEGATVTFSSGRTQKAQIVIATFRGANPNGAAGAITTSSGFWVTAASVVVPQNNSILFGVFNAGNVGITAVSSLTTISNATGATTSQYVGYKKVDAGATASLTAGLANMSPGAGVQCCIVPL